MPCTWLTASFACSESMTNLPGTMVFGLFFRTVLIPQIQNFAGNFLPSVLSSYLAIRFAIGFSFQATVPALRWRLSARVTCCCITIHASAESLNRGGKTSLKIFLGFE